MEEGGRLETDTGDRIRPSRLTRLKLERYKSFRSEEVTFGDVTVLLGANGAGKSNLVSFFGMLGFLSTGALQESIGRAGRSDSLLFAGRRTSPQLSAELEFVGTDAKGRSTTTTYQMRLGDAAPDTLIFLEERVRYHRSDFASPRDILLGAGHRESRLIEKEREGDTTCRILLHLLWAAGPITFTILPPRPTSGGTTTSETPDTFVTTRATWRRTSTCWSRLDRTATDGLRIPFASCFQRSRTLVWLPARPILARSSSTGARKIDWITSSVLTSCRTGACGSWPWRPCSFNPRTSYPM